MKRLIGAAVPVLVAGSLARLPRPARGHRAFDDGDASGTSYLSNPMVHVEVAG